MINTYTYLYLFIYIYINVHIYLYIYIYTCIYIYTHIHIKSSKSIHFHFHPLRSAGADRRSEPLRRQVARSRLQAAAGLGSTSRNAPGVPFKRIKGVAQTIGKL